jgi:ribosomal protein L19
MSLIQLTEDKALKKDLTSFNVGDTVKVHVLIKNASRSFKGISSGKKAGG